MLRVLFALLLAGAFTIQGDEVCRFRALDAENPFLRWLRSEEVTCVDSGWPVEFPAGRWNVFVRSPDTISAVPLLIEGDGEAVNIVVGREPAATLVPTLPPGHRAVVWVPRDRIAYPVTGSRATVPAARELWLFVLDGSTPVAVVPIGPLAPREEHAVDARSSGRSMVVGWLHVPREDRFVFSDTLPLETPAVMLGGRRADPLPAPRSLDGTFYRVRGVAPGHSELTLGGDGWFPQRQDVQVSAGLTVVEEPLLVRPSATLEVHWKTEQDLAALDRSLGWCAADENAPGMEIVLLKCIPPRRGEAKDTASCTSLRRERVEQPFGTLKFVGVEPGDYRAELRYGKLPSIGTTTSVGPLQSASLRLTTSYVEIDGTITRGGEPLGEAVRVDFRTGHGFAPAETSKYRAVLTEHAGGIVHVRACDGAPAAVVLADPRRRYDLHIPANELSVLVTDIFSGKPLSKAAVLLEAMSAAHPSRPTPPVVYTETLRANEDGVARMAEVPVRDLRLTVTHPGYEKQAVDPFFMAGTGTREVHVEMIPLRGRSGRIVSSRRFRNAVVVWFSAEGMETERADVAEDGTFAYASEHLPAERLCVVSESHPLWVMNAPPEERWTGVTLQFPEAPARTFDVWGGSTVHSAMRYIGLSIGGVRVPQPMLALHQTLRQDPPLMRGYGPQHFRAVLATGPIEVLFGPTVEEVAAAARDMDIFALPKFANVPRQQLNAGSESVSYWPK